LFPFGEIHKPTPFPDQLGEGRVRKNRKNLKELIRTMSTMNPTWGSPHIVGELAKLGITVAKSTVEKYRARNAVALGRIHIRSDSTNGLPRLLGYALENGSIGHRMKGL